MLWPLVSAHWQACKVSFVLLGVKVWALGHPALVGGKATCSLYQEKKQGDGRARICCLWAWGRRMHEGNLVEGAT